MKTSELTGVALDFAVAKALYGERLVHYRTWLETINGYWKGKDCSFAPLNEFRILSEDFDGVTTAPIKPYSTDWAHGGPVIDANDISQGSTRNKKEYVAWRGCASDFGMVKMFFGKTKLIAAMRCYAASELGDEVEIPEELI